MNDDRALLQEIHALVNGPARLVLERLCREWLQGRRQAIAEAPLRPEWQGENTWENRARHRKLCEARESRIPLLPWPQDGREVVIAGQCAVLAIFHDANCPRCERKPLFPMPDERDDGIAWTLLRDAIAAHPDADAMQDTLNAVRESKSVASACAPPPPAKPDEGKGEGETIELDGTGELIIDTLGRNEIDSSHNRWFGKKIATTAKTRFNSHFKSTLSHLRQVGLLANPGRGYYLDAKGQALYQQRKKDQQKVRTKSGLG